MGKLKKRNRFETSRRLVPYPEVWSVGCGVLGVEFGLEGLGCEGVGLAGEVPHVRREDNLKRCGDNLKGYKGFQEGTT